MTDNPSRGSVIWPFLVAPPFFFLFFFLFGARARFSFFASLGSCNRSGPFANLRAAGVQLKREDSKKNNTKTRHIQSGTVFKRVYITSELAGDLLYLTPLTDVLLFIMLILYLSFLQLYFPVPPLQRALYIGTVKTLWLDASCGKIFLALPFPPPPFSLHSCHALAGSDSLVTTRLAWLLTFLFFLGKVKRPLWVTFYNSLLFYTGIHLNSSRLSYPFVLVMAPSLEKDTLLDKTATILTIFKRILFLLFHLFTFDPRMST